MVQPFSPFLLSHNREMARIRQNQQQFAEQQAVKKQASDVELAGNLARGILSAPEDQKQQSYQESLRMFSEQGGDINGMPTSFTKEVIPMLEQMSAMSPSSVKDSDSQLDYLKAGFDPSRVNEEGYVQDVLSQVDTGDIKGEFGYALNLQKQIENNPEIAAQYTEGQKAQLNNFINTKAKGFDTLRSQTIATEEPKLQLKQQYEPTTEGLKEEAKQKVQLEYEPQVKVATATAEAKRKGKQKLAGAESSFKAMSKNIDKIQKTVEENPELFGVYGKSMAKLSQITKGKEGFTKEQMKIRGGAVNQITQSGLQMLGLATEAGLSGINTVEEAKRVIGNLSPDSSAEEIQGATEALLSAKEDILTELRARFGEKEEQKDPKIQEALDAGYTMEQIEEYLK